MTKVNTNREAIETTARHLVDAVTRHDLTLGEFWEILRDPAAAEAVAPNERQLKFEQQPRIHSTTVDAGNEKKVGTRKAVNKKPRKQPKDLRRRAQQAMKKLHPGYPDTKDGRIRWGQAFEFLKAKGETPLAEIGTATKSARP